MEVLDVLGFCEFLEKRDSNSLNELENYAIKNDEYDWSSQIGSLDQDVNSNGLPGEEEYSEMTQARIELEGSIVSLQVTHNHSEGNSRIIFDCTYDSDSDLFKSTAQTSFKETQLLEKIYLECKKINII